MPLRSVDVAGVSGHPGSPHYDDQIALWSAGEYHEFRLDGQTAAAGPALRLEPPSA